MDVIVDEEVQSNDCSKCKLCLKEVSLYTCPRCNIRYCSLTCYKSVAHASCSEGFYKDCFMEGLKDMKSPGDKQKVVEMLKRVSEQDNIDSADTDEDDDLTERLQGINLDTDTSHIWSRLTETERAEFRSMMHDGRLGELITVWEPWWNTECTKEDLVVEMSEDQTETCKTTEERASETPLPNILDNIADINLLLKNKPPSELLKYNLINIIYGYAYVSRLYNGEYTDIPSESSQELLLLSHALGTKTFKSTTDAIDGCLLCLANQAGSLYVSQAYSTGVLLDVQRIVVGPTEQRPSLYVLCALSEIQALFIRAVKGCSKKRHKGGQGDCDRSDCQRLALKQQLFAAQKKCEFLLSWVIAYGAELQECVPDLDIQICEMFSRLAAHEQVNTKVTQEKQKLANRPQNLIEVLPAEKPS